MGYCTLDDLQDRYGEAMLIALSFRGDSEPDAPDTDLFDRVIADACALIDGYLKPRYQLPLAETPPLITDLALKIAIYNAHSDVASDKIRKDYDDALKVLTQISAGTVRLDVAGVEPAGSGSQGARLTDRDRPLTADNLKGYI